MSGERRPFLGLSWFQLIAGALAAMTSAWIASALGVAGTIIGAAVGSFVAAISSAFYANSLDRTRTLIVRTDSGTIVETAAEPGETVEALEAVRDATDSEIQGAQVVDEPRRRIGIPAVIASTAVVLLLAGVAMGAYELVTDKSYGVKTDNAKIGNPFGGSSKQPSTPDDSPEPTVTTSDVPTPTETVSPTPSETVPTDPTPTASTTSPPPVVVE